MVECGPSNCSDLPDITIELGSGEAAKQYKFKKEHYLTLESPLKADYLFAFQPMDIVFPEPFGNEKAWILGDKFLTEYYSIYDY